MTRCVAQRMVAELRKIQFVPATPFLSDMMVIVSSECLEMPHQSKSHLRNPEGYILAY